MSSGSGSGSGPGSGSGSGSAGRSAWRGGEGANRSGQLGIIVVFGTLFLILAAAAVLFAALKAPAPAKSVCPQHRDCINPPRKTGLPSFASLAAPLQLANKVFTSSVLGYRIEYPSQFQIGQQTSNGIELVSPNGAFIVLLNGVSASQATPSQLLARTVSSLRGSIPDLQTDPSSSAQILAPALGGRAGIGGYYQGDFDSPTGPVAPADVAVLAASDGHQTIALAAICANRSDTVQFLQFVDQEMLNTLRFQASVAR